MTLTFGSKGSAVRRLQTNLNSQFQQLGMLAEMAVRVDGFFGAETLARVKFLQCVGGLPVDGRVCDRTLPLSLKAQPVCPFYRLAVRALRSLLCSKRSQPSISG